MGSRSRSGYGTWVRVWFQVQDRGTGQGSGSRSGWGLGFGIGVEIGFRGQGQDSGWRLWSSYEMMVEVGFWEKGRG